MHCFVVESLRKDTVWTIGQEDRLKKGGISVEVGTLACLIVAQALISAQGIK